jgi:multicomponent Na+:H+ antiporter subunit B
MSRTPYTDLILRWTAGFMMVALNMVAIYLLLRGHHLPGGGFIGGLISALSILLFGLATGMDGLEDRLRLDPLRVAAAGLLAALVSALIPVAVGQPFLEHFQGYLPVPLWGEVYWGTPLLFDLGVMLLVLGITTKIILVLARSMSGRTAVPEAQRTRYAAAAEQPIETGGRDGR